MSSWSLICQQCRGSYHLQLGGNALVSKFCSNACRQKSYYHRNRTDILARLAGKPRIPHVMPDAEAQRLRRMVAAEWRRR